MNEVLRPLLHMTADEFLAWPGDDSGRRFQLVDGEVRAMAPASRTHSVIQANLAFLVVGAVRAFGRPLQVLTEGAIIPGLSAEDNVRVPDLVVAPGDDARGDQVVPDPILIIEILSPGNAKATRDNLRAFATLPSVTEIVTVQTSRVAGEVYRRNAAGSWPPAGDLVARGERLRLTTVGLDCLLDEVYASTWLTR